jgi:thimet oligopeptidase
MNSIRQKPYMRLVLMALAVIIGAYSYTIFRKHFMIHALCTTVKNSADALALFPTSVATIQAHTAQAIKQAQQELQNILAIPNDQRTFANTAQAFDHLSAFSQAMLSAATISTLELVHPDEAIRNAAHETLVDTQNFFIENVSANKELYNAFKAYVESNAKKENLSDEQKKFLEDTMDDFERAGLNLPQEKLEEVKRVRKDLVKLELEFDKNIAHDQPKVTVNKAELGGLSEDFIKSLDTDTVGNYILGTDYPTYLQVMENCTVSQTRRKIWDAYMNRAYPVNKKILQDIIAKRYELAQLLGYPTYAALELDSEMVETPERAAQFLNELNSKAQVKVRKEFKEFTKKLPESVVLTKDGKLQPWDVLFLKNQYKKTAFNLDENKVAEYFPMQHTVDKLLDIYQQFLNLTFKQLPAKGLWDPEVKLIEVIDNTTNQTVGYLFLDLFPRANKYTHACEHTIIPVTYDLDGKPNLGVVIVIANFPKPRADKPALLHLKDVNTFFHEFGHAMHALLGRTQIVSFAGTNVKRDFVEMPSQMLEEWLWDTQILKMVSSHYQTHEPLPDDLIATILKARTFDSGFFIVRQMYLAKLALAYFNNGPDINLDAVLKKIFNECLYGIRFDDADHNYAAFGHLTGYGARYYGYMWSKVFAHDLFGQIKQEGLLNPVAGRRYIDGVIGKGGSKDPNDLLKNFLGREPNQNAFLHDMGL